MFGGKKLDGGNSMTPDGSTIYLYGRTESQDFPVTDKAFQKTLNGEGDMFITILKWSDVSAFSAAPPAPGSPRIVSVWPNPTTSVARLEIESTEWTPAKTRLYAIDGREIRDLGGMVLRAGTNFFTADLSLLPPGEYILSIETHRGKHTKSIIKY